MIKNVIEDYLSSIKEIEFFLPFQQLLISKHFFDVHIIHGPVEFGKDIVAKYSKNDSVTQYFFQVKADDINLHRLRTDVIPQLLEASLNGISHPNFNKSLDHKVVFVTTGIILTPATIEFQEFNETLKNKYQVSPIECWEREKLIEEFLKIGIEPFFSLHNSPAFLGRFINFYSDIKTQKPKTYLEIEKYTKHWLTLDWSIRENKLQVFFETYLFSKIFIENCNYYECALLIAGLIRCLIFNDDFDNYRTVILEYLFDTIDKCVSKVKEIKDTHKSIIYEIKGFFSIFYYPIYCHRVLELLAIRILFSDTPAPTVKELFFQMIDSERGCFHPISDNYACTIILTSLSLIKLNEIDRLKKYLNNTAIWICDRYENVGLSPFGSTVDEEFEQLLSENLSGYKCNKRKTSFLANAILEICFIIGDSEFYHELANEFKATEIILEFFHVFDDDSLFTIDNRKIVTTTDARFSVDYREEYSNIVTYERSQNKITLRRKELIFLIFLLRDRYFPTFLRELI